MKFILFLAVAASAVKIIADQTTDGLNRSECKRSGGIWDRTANICNPADAPEPAAAADPFLSEKINCNTTGGDWQADATPQYCKAPKDNKPTRAEKCERDGGMWMPGPDGTTF